MLHLLWLVWFFFFCSLDYLNFLVLSWLFFFGILVIIDLHGFLLGHQSIWNMFGVFIVIFFTYTIFFFFFFQYLFHYEFYQIWLVRVHNQRRTQFAPKPRYIATKENGKQECWWFHSARMNPQKISFHRTMVVNERGSTLNLEMLQLIELLN